jgi:hypothetical protein
LRYTLLGDVPFSLDNLTSSSMNKINIKFWEKRGGKSREKRGGKSREKGGGLGKKEAVNLGKKEAVSGKRRRSREKGGGGHLHLIHASQLVPEQ